MNKTNKKLKQIAVALVCVIAVSVIIISAVISSRSGTGKPTVDNVVNHTSQSEDNTDGAKKATDNTSASTTAQSSDKEQQQTTSSDSKIKTEEEKTSQSTTASQTKQTEITKPDESALCDSNEIMMVSSQIKSVCGNSYKSEETGRKVVDADTEYWNLVVVNKNREYDSDYKPSLSPAIPGSDIELDSRVAPYYTQMYNAAKKDGIYLTPFSGYRRYSTQERNYNNLTEEYMSRYNLSRKDAAEKAATVILPPGTSEHNLGLAMDICSIYDSFADTDEYAWLIKYAQDYGFILRYTAEKQSITGIVPEPWHWRFVGIENAKKIKASGLCLEEYLDSLGIEY